MKTHTNTAILFLTHCIDEEILHRFHLLHDSCSKEYDVYFGLNDEKGCDMACLYGFRTFTFTCADIMSQGYTPHGHQVMHNVNYVVQLFRKQHPEYAFYWVVEYDAVFMGNWLTLFSFYDNDESDFIAAHIERYSERNKNWPWWTRVVWKNAEVSSQQYVKSFNPIIRISGEALDFMDGFLKKGVCGHYELIEATALFNNGFRLLDMGGRGEFSDPNYPNHFYVQGMGVNDGTMRWRPAFLKAEVEAFANTNKIFHPLKT